MAEKVPETLSAKILAERDKGNAVLVEMDGLHSVPVSTLVDQTADGILYDLNRLEEVALTFLPDVQWVNNFAVALVIRELKARLAEAEKGDVPELKRLLGMAQANPDLVDVDLWNEEVDAAFAPKETP